MTARLLVTGAGGLVGGALCEALAPRDGLWAGVRRSSAPAGLRHVETDLDRPESLASAVATAGAEVVVHSAALADADACEREPARARRLNVDATEALTDACARAGSRLLLISTDLVFGDEELTVPRTESCLARPLSVYASTKVEAEQLTLREPGNAAFRIALVSGRGYGARSTCTESIAWALRAGRPLRPFRDQFRTPVDPVSLARAVAAFAASDAGGLFHIGGPERVSRFELGLRVATVLGLDASDIVGITHDAGPAATARRPRQAALDSSRAARLLGYRPESLAAAIRAGRREATVPGA